VHMPVHYVIEHIDTSNAGGKAQYDTTYHQVNDLVLTNQLGKTISLNKDLKGKMVVIDFFFVNCPTICPRMTRNMAAMEKAFAKDPKKETSLDTAVQFISITVNPEHDSFPVLRAYADHYGANHDHWWFLTGDKKTIYNFARNELHVDVPPGDGSSADFIHTDNWVLLDKNRYIRGYYNGLDTAGLKHCADDIVLLSIENDHTNKKTHS